jgi:hypothetical protein
VTVAELFDDYAAAFARGERPDVRAYLDRAGAERDELARLIDAFLRSAVPPPPGEEAVVALRARLSGDPPLLALRKQRAVRVDEVVDELLRTQGWATTKRAKVKRYYHELEGGLLEPKRVDRRVWDVLAGTLNAAIEDLRGWRPRPAALQFEAAYRVADVAAQPALERVAVPADKPDEIDELFGKA